ncbi:MAG TPA: UDP-N-acetylmuramate dehydrogenase [Candidatus Acidoferrales bacterium]|nr:UDP-N-acetylmuramate dehydrogenase [Candidatus Acidoferrales bacterium]
MNALRMDLRGSLRYHEPMAPHTSWRVGGPAEIFFAPADADDLAAFLAGLPADMPLFWMGLGSNLLVRDGGIDGVVIATSRGLGALQRLTSGAVRAEAGVPCAKLARLCEREGLAGGAFFAGIPGTLGGALAMNAGAFGGETWAQVTRVEVMNRAGARFWRDAAAYEVGYRHVVTPVPGEWFIAAEWRFESADEAALTGPSRIRELLARRAATQPLGLPSCGSVFRNPLGDHAARLIEAAGLKGVRIGDAEVSTKHANFIINRGQARAADIEALIERIQAAVWSRFGVELVPEVRIVGRAA